jgi:hypothetical protein
LKINDDFAQFAFLPVSLPSDTGHAPSLRNTFLRGPIPRNPFLRTVVASKDQQTWGENTIENQWWLYTISIPPGASPFRHGARPVSTKYIFERTDTPQSLSANCRDAACRVSPAKINKHGGKYNWKSMMILHNFHSSRCLSLPTRGTPRLYEIHFERTDTPQSLSANRRDAACRVSPAKINKHGGKI